MTSELQRQRHIELEGTTNLRNLGGYHTIDDSKTTKWGVLYRSDQLADIPADKVQSVLVDQLHIHDAYDLRGAKEVSAKSYAMPHITRYGVVVEPSKITEFMTRGEDMSQGATTFRAMEAVYRQLVTDYGATLGGVVKSLLASAPSPERAAVIHCTGGKDRTGWLVYLLLTLLGVEEGEKRRDYLLTNTYFKRPATAFNYFGHINEDAMKALFNVYEEFLDAALEEVDKLGGVEAYAKSHMGLTDQDVEDLRTALLE